MNWEKIYLESKWLYALCGSAFGGILVGVGATVASGQTIWLAGSALYVGLVNVAVIIIRRKAGF